MIQIHSSKHEGRVVLKLSGELTIYEASEAWHDLHVRQENHPDLALDLSGVANIDTAGVQVLYWLKRNAREHGHSLTIQHHSAAVMEVFDQLNLASAFEDPILLSPSGS
ncbi:MAG TPA: STAS domain-containing protein [Holophaga sp.]|nr:STAS domain-containing protein [Holophaga sp.]